MLPLVLIEVPDTRSSRDVYQLTRTYPENTLLLVVRTIGRGYRLYRVRIDWAAAGTKPSAVHPHTSLNPRISVFHLKISSSALEDVASSSRMTNDVSQAPPQLSHLELIPVGPQSKSSELTFPTILMVLSQVQGPQSPTYQDSFSIVIRWELRGVAQKLHPRFDQLASKNKSTSSFQLVGSLGTKSHQGGLNVLTRRTYSIAMILKD